MTFEYYAKNKTYLKANFIYVCTKFGQNWLRNIRRKSKMAATKFSFFYISTSDRGYFPRIIEITLFSIFSGSPQKVLYLSYWVKIWPSLGQNLKSLLLAQQTIVPVPIASLCFVEFVVFARNSITQLYNYDRALLLCAPKTLLIKKK